MRRVWCNVGLHLVRQARLRGEEKYTSTARRRTACALAATSRLGRRREPLPSGRAGLAAAELKVEPESISIDATVAEILDIYTLPPRIAIYSFRLIDQSI